MARYRLLVVPLIAAICGCVKEKPIQGGYCYTGDHTFGGVLLLVGLVLVGVSFLLLSKRVIRGGISCLLFAIGALLFSISNFTEYAEITSDGLRTRTGVFPFQDLHEVKFDNVTSVRGYSEERRGRRGRKYTDFYFEFQMKSGSPEKVKLTSLLQKGAADRIVFAVASRDIPINGIMPVAD
jgi:hypothetical protein